MIAVDTNILIYRIDRSEPAKRATARALLNRLVNEGECVLLWQVLGELMRQLHAWRHEGRYQADDVQRVVQTVRGMFPLVTPTPAAIDRAIRYAVDYSLSHWDSMLVAACAEAGIETLYTEDMGAPRLIDAVQLVNPF